jgi:arylsulfatase A-like enzyme
MSAEQRSMNRPLNMLWIVTTQWRAQACGYAGDPNASTPHLDALAAESVNFVQAVTPHPFGPFARAALLTGVTSPENGVRDYHDPLPTEARTIAHAFREPGYATAFFGKWHLAARARNAPIVGDVHARMIIPPESRGGFETWEGFESGFLLNDPWLHGTRIETPVKFPGYQSDVVCQRAGAWTTRASPWFCVVSLEPPHPPYDAPSGHVVPSPPEKITLAGNVPRGGAVESRARRELAGYYAHIAATDHAIGSLLAALPRDETVVIFTSVHGDMHGAHELFRKGWPHEESIRVPLLMRAPGLAPGVDHAPISLVELGAWSTAWAGAALTRPSRTNESGISMPSVVALPHQCDRAWRGIRTAARKLVLNADGSPWLYFDLERDPLERENLVSNPDRSAEMAELRAKIQGQELRTLTADGGQSSIMKSTI